MALPSSIQQIAGMIAVDRWVSRDELEAMMAYRDSRLLWHVLGKSSLTRAERYAMHQVLGHARDPLDNLRMLFDTYRAIDPANQQMVADLMTYLPDQILPMTDRATMARSVEGRVPFLDVPLVEFAFSVSGRTKMGCPRSAKRLLKKAIADLVPEMIVKRTKVGMTSPFPRLIANERAFVRSVLLQPNSYIRTLFPHETIDSLLATEDKAYRNFRLLYGLLLLEVWQAKFIQQRDYSKPERTSMRREWLLDRTVAVESSAALS
jgi:asparagine synthetase B (glutamine-hydrolysing)